MEVDEPSDATLGSPPPPPLLTPISPTFPVKDGAAPAEAGALSSRRARSLVWRYFQKARGLPNLRKDDVHALREDAHGQWQQHFRPALSRP